METSVQQIFHNAFPAYSKCRPLPMDHLKAAFAFMTCRTAAQGGHVQACPDGHMQGIWYNSCKHQSCPQCNKIGVEQWLRAQKEKLIDTSHHHLVFTIPHDLNELWIRNSSLMTDLLFRATSETLKTLLKSQTYLGAETGFILSLHTWGRNLSLHPHIHCLITDGGLNHKGEWIQPVKKCFLPFRVVMQLFRGKLCAFLREDIHQLILPPDMSEQLVHNLLNKLGRTDWKVYIPQKYDYATGVAIYLSRYVKGGPIHNHQLKREGDNIVLSYTSHKTKTRETISFTHETFIKRLLIHVPSHGKRVIRTYGLYAASCIDKLNKARAAHKQKPAKKPLKLDWREYLESTGQAEKGLCPTCKKRLVIIDTIPRTRDPTKPLSSLQLLT